MSASRRGDSAPESGNAGAPAAAGGPARRPLDLSALDAWPPDGLGDAVGHAFGDPDLLRTALTHRSFVNEYSVPAGAERPPDNERLEFLGDAVIGYRVGERLFRALPSADEGELTRLRAALVCQASLARFAAAVDLGGYLRIGRGEVAAGGRARPALLCGAFEAVVGAVYLDSGMRAASSVVDRFVEPEIERMSAALRTKDARSLFQERVQALWKVTPRYAVAAQIGPDHAKRFVVEVKVGERVWAKGEGLSKAEASQAAAAEALEALDRFEREDEAAPRR